MSDRSDRPFDRCTHRELADLAREYLLAGQMIDRAGMPHLISAYGRDEMEAIAIEEWMGASPIYSKRMQRTLDFEHDDVATIFKGMQLDIGAPPEFMDFRYAVHDHDHGEFWLDHCGALMDVEPMGDDYVLAMCHHIEDPTFEATACASNPRARMSPVHRPPRTPADRHPHCHWNVTIEPSADPLNTPERCALIASTLAAAVPPAPPDDAHETGDGWNDYAHELDPDMRMDDFSTAALHAILREVAIQSHLLVASFTASIAERHGTETAVDIGARQFAGVAGLTAMRLGAARGSTGDLASIADCFEFHPAFTPRGYVDWHVSLGDDSVELRLDPCHATRESATPMWGTLLADGHDRAIDTIARAINPAAIIDRGGSPDGGRHWTVTLGASAHPEDPDVTLTKFSSGATFEFRRVGRRDGT